MTNELDDFLNGTQGENKVAEDPFEKGDKVIEDTEIEEDKDEKPLPFNKDPKVQRFIEKEISKRLAEKKPTTETEKFSKESGDKGDEADEILTRIIGNDTPEKQNAIKDFKKYLASLEERGAQKAIAQLRQADEQEKAEEKEAVETLESGFESIEETFGVDLTSNTQSARKTRGEFVDFIRRVSPKDEEGNVVSFPDLEETFKLFQERQPKTASRAKELASRSMTRSGESTAGANTGDRSWDAVEKLFNK